MKLSGIGGSTPALDKAGLLHIKKKYGSAQKILMYAFDNEVDNTKRMLLLSLRGIREAGVQIFNHMDESLSENSTPLQLYEGMLHKAQQKRKMCSSYSAKTPAELFLVMQKKVESKRKQVVGQYKKAGSKGRCCRTLERGSDEKHSLVYLHFVLNQYIFVV